MAIHLSYISLYRVSWCNPSSFELARAKHVNWNKLVPTGKQSQPVHMQLFQLVSNRFPSKLVRNQFNCKSLHTIIC